MIPDGFILKKIIFSKNDFTLGWGNYRESGKMQYGRLGVRWEHFPRTESGKPQWVAIHNDLRVPILRSVVGLEGTDNEAVINALKQLHNKK